MTREQKSIVVAELTEKLNENQFFYITDCSTLSVEQINKLRRECFNKGVEMRVFKNTLIRKAMEQVSDSAYSPLYESLSGPTAVLFSPNSNLAAKLIKDFRKDKEIPRLKAAYIDTDVFIGDDQLEILTALKSKEELVGDVIALLQSPMKNVIGALKSSGTTIAGLVKTLSERS